jgi:hypothetical protein
MAMVLRGAFRLVVGCVVTVTAAWSVLWLLEAALGKGLWLANHMWLSVALAIGAALAVGVALAVALDRAWIRIRGRGPELSLRRR